MIVRSYFNKFHFSDIGLILGLLIGLLAFIDLIIVAVVLYFKFCRKKQDDVGGIYLFSIIAGIASYVLFVGRCRIPRGDRTCPVWCHQPSSDSPEAGIEPVSSW